MQENYYATRFVPGQIWMVQETNSEAFSNAERTATFTKKRPHIVIAANRMRVMLLACSTHMTNFSNWRLPITFEEGKQSFVICDHVVMLKSASMKDADYLTTLSNDVLKDVLSYYIAANFGITFGKDDLQYIANNAAEIYANHKTEDEPNGVSFRDSYLDKLTEIETENEVVEDTETTEALEDEDTVHVITMTSSKSKEKKSKRRYSKRIHSTEELINKIPVNEWFKAIFVTGEDAGLNLMTAKEISDTIREVVGINLDVNHELALLTRFKSIGKVGDKYICMPKSKIANKTKYIDVMCENYTKYGFEVTCKIWGYADNTMRRMLSYGTIHTVDYVDNSKASIIL